MANNSIENIFHDVSLTILNAFQNYLKQKVIPEMVDAFGENDVQVNPETFEEFF